MEKNNKKLKIGAIVQVRTGSTRLPGKVMLNIEGKPMLWHVINRVKASKKLEDIILAIPDTKENDILEEFAKENGINFFRGSESDVLERYYEAAKKFNINLVVRITSDCPMIDPQIIDSVIQEHLTTGAEYSSNVNVNNSKRTFPRGLDVEVFNFEVLKKLCQTAKEGQDREHVTLYIRQHPEFFHIANYEYEKDLSWMRWTVDTKEDLEFAREIYKNMYKKEKIFLMKEILNFLEKNPGILEINKDIEQKKHYDNFSKKSKTF